MFYAISIQLRYVSARSGDQVFLIGRISETLSSGQSRYERDTV